MNRRACLLILIGMIGTAEAGAKVKKFAFRIKTKDGNIVGNVVIQANDVEAAKVKLMRRYPNCTILNLKSD